ncbi:succinylglutamate desuccinylase/aspartoacylase family protein [Solirubrobacter soli]|uniref:succinylglutamate desuccinylase/aspartoacylase family protein n=1 Tax=Solirubrobacter soli TaxID=363832 RepID=UPI000483247C|nr:succinylglutamate desuccinylase/aspartoacylase family protein [Solirubrobacter soli]
MRTTITLDEVAVPAFDLTGAHDGPHLSLIGGVHGCEYSSIAAVIDVMRGLEPAQLHGRITAVPVVSMDSFTQRSPFVVPADGKNLNRSFPGDPDGTYTDRLAHDIHSRLIAPADAFIDLHGGDLVEALEPFALFADPGSRELALAMGLPYVVDYTESDALTGMSVATKGVIAEAGGAGRLEAAATKLLVDGTRNALKLLKMLDGEPDPPRSRIVRRFEWLYSTHAGFWVAHAATGEHVRAGQVLGEVRDLYGDTLEEAVAPTDGVILFLTTSAALDESGLMLGLGTEFADG